MNIIFDIGNVILEWNPAKLVASVFKDAHEQTLALEKIIHHDDWTQLDKGTMSVEDATTRAAERTGLPESSIGALYDATPPSLLPIPETVALIRELSARNFKLYIISNMSKDASRYIFDAYDFWDLFDGMVISSRINIVKPELAIYKQLLEQYKLEPSSTIFIDDMPVNIEAAQSLGMKGIHFLNPLQAKTELYETIGIR